MAIDLKQLHNTEQSLASNDNRQPALLSQWSNTTDILSYFTKKPGVTDRFFFTEQLSLLLETGNSLTQSLDLLVSQTENPAMRDIIIGLIEQIKNGNSLSNALRSQPELFSSTYINLVEVSENGGFMPKVLQELLSMDEKKEKLNATIRSSLSYPIFLLSFSFAVVIFVLVAIFPKFEEMFGSIVDELPASTRFLMAFSNSLTSHWMIYLCVIVASLVACSMWFKNSSGQHFMDNLKLKTPILKNIFSELYTVQLLRVMGLSLDNGVSIMDTLASCREVVNNSLFNKFILSLEVSVQEGRGIAVGFKDADIIPFLVRQMVATGEESGSLPKVMTRVASYYERQLEKRLTAISKTAEPVMLLVMGVIVGVLVSSLILPIFKLSSAAG